MAKRQKAYRYINVPLDADLAEAIDNYMISLGLDSKGQTAAALIRVGLSAAPINTMVFEMSQEALRQARKREFQALSEYFDLRAKLYKES